MEHLGAEPIENRESNVGPVLSWIDVHAERPLAELFVDHVDYGLGDKARIGIGWDYRGERFLHLFAETLIRSILIFFHAS